MNASAALINLLLGELGLAILVGGAVGLLLLWYIRGRDKPHGLIADYLREPPSDLHPGLIGTLLDEHANSHDVVATLINLGHRGALEIATPSRRQKDYRLTLVRRDLPFSKVEQLLIEVLFGKVARPFAQRVLLNDVRAQFVAAIPQFKVALYDEVVAAGFFLASPRATRLRYRRWGAAILLRALKAALLPAPVTPEADTAPNLLQRPTIHIGEEEQARIGRPLHAGDRHETVATEQVIGTRAQLQIFDRRPQAALQESPPFLRERPEQDRRANDQAGETKPAGHDLHRHLRVTPQEQ